MRARRRRGRSRPAPRPSTSSGPCWCGPTRRLREPLNGLGPVTLIRRCADLPTATTEHSIHAATITVLRSLARRVLALTDETRALQQQMSKAVAACAPQLLDQYGVGSDTAAALLIAAGDNPDRLANQAAFAALCGVNPIEASSA